MVIGYLEPHGRAETIALVEGLEILPRRNVDYRGRPLEEMDLPGVLARRPELCLIDELAHTNAPGVEHEKRYEDVRDVIEAGIDVYSTVNVQHLESLNDQMTELTGARVRETIPDEVLQSADEVVLIDLTPEALIARLRAGKVYPPELQAGGAQQLLQDREPRRAARDPRFARWPRTSRSSAWCASHGRSYAATRRGSRPQPRAHRRRSPSGCLRWRRSRRIPERVVRRAWRSAQRLDAGSTCWWCARSGGCRAPRTAARLEWLRRLVFDARRAAARRGGGGRGGPSRSGSRASSAAPYVLLGTPGPRRVLGRVARGGADLSVLTRLLAGLPGVDVRIVADPTMRRAAGEVDESTERQAGNGANAS